MELSDLDDLYTVCVVDGESLPIAAFSFAVWEADLNLIGYIFMVAVDENQRKKGYFSRFVAALKGFMADHIHGRNYRSAWILTGMSKETKPHETFKKAGFT